ncbi:Hint domain-containing protein [Acetobacter pasteurianus]|uniref:Hint domain-containing protein n=1 Tax=Acetobacter pasteurianus TaxID=438 RepID=UPI0013628C0D|nr:Hint domain-containing protein [Acetobacter pasteurianus]QHM91092.1 Hint domain-containing protein [Acetobacter pasteurianus]
MGGKGVAVTINSSGNWSDLATDSTDIILDGTASPITLNIIAHNYGGWTEGDTENSNFHDVTMTVKGDVTLTGDGYLSINNNLTNDATSFTVESTNFSVNGTLSGNTVTIANGGSLSVGTLTAPVTFGASPSDSSTYNTLIVNNYAASGTLTINNLSPRDQIVFSNGQTTSLSWSDNGNEIVDQNGDVLANVTFADGYTKDDYSFNGDTVTVTCFLAGSMIRTPEGEKAVENIQLGDDVLAFDWQHNKNVARTVVWAGKAHAHVQADLADDEAGWPVRILENAIAPGVPYKDMLVTAEHCLFFNGKFVPARMLVNGVSIFYDKSITSYDYYHVETEQHAVITADGVQTESYLDTGNRSSFRQLGKVVALRGKAKSWAHDAGAPLGVERAFVEPLFYALSARARKIASPAVCAQTAKTTTDPDLHLVTNTGAIVRPLRKETKKYSFMLPSGTQFVRVVSRASRPADVIGPFVDDRRYMGVAVMDVRLFCATLTHDITAHLQAEKPAGWHASDWTDCAWTNGDAVLPLGDYLTNGNMGILSMTIQQAGPYLAEDQKAANLNLLSA